MSKQELPSDGHFRTFCQRSMTRVVKYLLFVILALLSSSAFAEIDKTATPNDKGFSLYWWPKIAAPAGWHQDKDYSFHDNINAFAPDHYTFNNAVTVIYAKADYKPRLPEIKSIEQLIDSDKKQFLSDYPGLEIKEVQPIITSDGKSLRSLAFAPTGKGNWERVSYGEEGDFYLTFAISSRSLKDYQATEKIYEDFVRGYK
jgi:hypothetical protein